MQLRRIALPLTLSLACSGLGCKSKEQPVQGAASASAQPSSVTSTTLASASAPSARKGQFRAPWTAIPSATAPELPNMGFAERFDIESKSRPSGIKPKVEEVYGAIEAAGIHLADKKQHLGSPFGARYCVGARVVPQGKDDTLYFLSVCEFVSDDVAKMSRDFSGGMAVPDRTVYANKQTTLTVREMTKSADNDALGTKIVETYQKLGR